ncbi:cation:proton antiporter regulatory subunit [Intrasporangium sp. DVR]|uniref:cation:proton antiporter regulatory subunit n=1 Tax=Intrasporangium sp. DVR TaxID=3127867 RepID=UPI00313A50AB
MEIEETLLPGVGIRYELATRAGRAIVVVVERDGGVQVGTYSPDDPDEAVESIVLDADEALAIGELLGAARMSQRFADLSREVPGLESARLPITAESPYGGRSLADTHARTRTGCSVVAIVRGDDVISSPTPSERLHVGDTLVAIGTERGLRTLAALIEKGWTEEVRALCAGPA